MKTDQAEQLDMILSQSTWVLSKDHDTEETNPATTSKGDNRSL